MKKLWLIPILLLMVLPCWAEEIQLARMTQGILGSGGVAAPANTPIAIVSGSENAVQANYSTSLGCPLGASTTAGNQIIVCIVFSGGSAATISSVADGHNTYASVIDVTGAPKIALYKAESIAGGAETVTVTCDAEAGNLSIAAFEVEGAATNSYDVGEYAVSGWGTSADSGNGEATSQNNCLLIGLIGHNSAGATNFAAGANWTLLDSANSIYVEHRTVSSTGTYDATASWTGDMNWSCIFAAFKD
ncbi:MAG: hypothetical protein V2B18_21325 [Pseudomonadota bacterium]